MSDSPIILNERDARRARSKLAHIDEFLSAPAVFRAGTTSLSPDVVEKHKKAVSAARSALGQVLQSYDLARAGNFKGLLAEWGGEPGIVLIIARVARGMSQGDLAARLGLHEQQIQRYEAERYRSISLQNYRRIAAALGVQLEAKIHEHAAAWLRQIAVHAPSFANEEIERIIQHARKYKWFDLPSTADEQRAFVVDYIRETVARYGSPTLLRTGLDVLDLRNDVSLAAWRARVFQLADARLAECQNSFDLLDISWLPDLVSLSAQDDGPLQAKALMLRKGMLLIAEPQIAGLRIDGAAFLVAGTPVIGMTIRHDRIDNFWFTLLHELGHVFLHQHTGLAAGFFDDFDHDQLDGFEMEANEFADAVLIPMERWRTSPARISKSPATIEDFASQIKIHPAILFGRIRKERNDYSIFSNRIGVGEVRKHLVSG